MSTKGLGRRHVGDTAIAECNYEMGYLISFLK
jgi:hypothetical protein